MSDIQPQPTIDELLDRAVRAINLGDRETAVALAGQVLAVDDGNPDAEELLSAPSDHGEIRRLTILFADLVDSTELSTNIELEVYRTVVGRYRDEVIQVVNHYEGHIASTKGDGLLAVFGHPVAHENDAHRAVQAGLDITREIAALSTRVRRRFGFDISVRVGIHRGLVYLDTAQDDVYGLGANLASRMCSLAAPGTVAVSAAIGRVVDDSFELDALTPRAVKGVEDLIEHYRVVGERDVTTLADGPMVGRDGELAYLRQSWADAMAGTLATPGVAFRGEGGIGKTRIAATAVDIAQQAGAVVLGMFGSPFHTDVGLKAGTATAGAPMRDQARFRQRRATSPATERSRAARVRSGDVRSAVGSGVGHRAGERLRTRPGGRVHSFTARSSRRFTPTYSHVSATGPA